MGLLRQLAALKNCSLQGRRETDAIVKLHLTQESMMSHVHQPCPQTVLLQLHPQMPGKPPASRQVAMLQGSCAALTTVPFATSPLQVLSICRRTTWAANTSGVWHRARTTGTIALTIAPSAPSVPPVQCTFSCISTAEHTRERPSWLLKQRQEGVSTPLLGLLKATTQVGCCFSPGVGVEGRGGRVGGGMGCAASIGAAALTVDTLRESSHHTPLLPSLIAMHQVRCHNFFRGECRKHHSHNGLAKSSQPLEMLHSLLARCSYACPDPAAALNAALHAVLMPVYIVICSSGICTVHACLLTVAHNQTLLEGLRGWIHVCFGKPRRATHGIMWQRGCRQTVTGAGSCCGAGYRESGDHTAGGQESRPGSGKQDNCRDSSAQSSSVGGRQQAGRQGPATTQAHSARSDGHLQDTDRHPEAYM